jgi:hypothetical protein
MTPPPQREGGRGDLPGEGILMAVDPGRARCGYAILRIGGAGTGTVERQGIVAPVEIAAIWCECQAAHGVITLIVGAGTGSLAVREALAAAGAVAQPVREHFTTRRGRDLYFDAHPPRGWRRLIPRALLTPPCPIDDFAAVAIAQEWIAAQSPVEAVPPRSDMRDSR